MCHIFTVSLVRMSSTTSITFFCTYASRRVLRSPNQFPSDVLDASVEALGRLGSEVHLTLLAELIDELRRLVTEDSNRLGPGVMLSAITSVVRMSSVMRQNGQIPVTEHNVFYNIDDAQREFFFL